jgi:hypothetical protein
MGRKITAGVATVALAAAAIAVDTTGAARTAQEDCPDDALSLPANALGPAANAALKSQRQRYEEMDTRPIVASAALAEFDRARGDGARRDCGRRVFRRTVVVHLESASRRFRERNPSLSQGVVFVSRVAADRYEVWRVVH